MKPTEESPASATACAGRAAREAAARPSSAPLPRVRFAVGGSHEGVVEGMAEPASDESPAGRKQEHRAMSGHDAELALFRRGVNCAALLESLVPGWKLDPKESTRRARLVGPEGHRQGRRVRPRAASRSVPELRSGPPGPALLRRRYAELSHSGAGEEGEGP